MPDSVISPESIGDAFWETISRGVNFHCNVIDRDYRILWHNRVPGESRRIGLLCYEFYQKRKEPCAVCPVRTVFESGEPRVVERERFERLPNGNPRWGEIRAYPIFGPQGEAEMVVTIGFDITEKKLAAERRRDLIDALQKKLVRLSRARTAASAAARRSPFHLTEREIQVLILVSEGLSNNQIADTLVLSPHTVKSHLINIFNKLGVNDRTEAAVAAARLNLV